MRFLIAVLLSLMALGIAARPAAASAREAAESYNKGDFAGALRACQTDAQAGDPSCQSWLGVLYAEGKGVKRDATEAARWFRRAAEQGHGAAAYNLARAYQEGDGVARDLVEAKKWARQAAEQGIPQAQLLMGLLGMPPDGDMKEAVKWFKLAAAQGMPTAQAVLGSVYELGDGVRRNYRSAAKWYEAAAEHGDRLAPGRLASLYERGLGVDADMEEAYFWYRVALKDADDPNRKEDEKGLKRVAAQLSKKQLDAAEEAVRDWRPQAAEIGPRSRSRKTKRQAAGPELFATGSGFFVSTAGHLVTNNHVVAQCAEVRVTEGEKATPAKVLATDPRRDLALLQLAHATPAAVFHGSERLRPGESVVVVGFPLSGLLTSDPVVTTGIISALAGPRDDRQLLQISAPIQPGNSGGPLLDASGHIVGVIVATMSTLKLAKATGSIPENINFAINGEEAKGFLKGQGIEVQTAPPGQPLSVAAVADQALSVTVRLECWK
ncbi:MAG TPA: tetratricopeptide repeat-containing serine protease family protein [Stellaceae bacterium]